MSQDIASSRCVNHSSIGCSHCGSQLKINQRRVVLDFKTTAKIGIFVADRVERMRVGRDDRLERGGGQSLDIRIGQHLEQTFLTDTPHIVALALDSAS